MARLPKYQQPSGLAPELEDELKMEAGSFLACGLSRDPEDFSWLGDPHEDPVDIEKVLSRSLEPEMALAKIARAIVSAYPSHTLNRSDDWRVEQAINALLGRRARRGPKQVVSDKLLDKILWEYHTRCCQGLRPLWTECIAAHVPSFPLKPNDRKSKSASTESIGEKTLSAQIMSDQQREVFYQRVMTRVKAEKNFRLALRTQIDGPQLQRRQSLIDEILSNLMELGVMVGP